MHLLRKLVTVGLFALLLVASYANALGLGEISLKSALNQPLHAEIRLLNIRELGPDDIIIRLASVEDFQRAGVERLFFYNDLQFEVVTRGATPVVRVTTRGPVREPYLNFLIEARWASGRLLREYTLLLDLPTFADEPAAPVEAARQASVPAPRPTAVPSPPTQRPTLQQPDRPQAQPEAPRAPAPRAAARSDVYTVNNNDTLWEIALQVRPNRSVTVQQTMIALQRRNPDAFINGNINLLRSGQILQVPTLEEIRALNNSQAISQVASQNREWSERRTGAQLDAGRRETAERRQPQDVSGQVKLATSTPGDDVAGGRGTGDARSERLSGELAAAQEELEKTRRENTELGSRVRDLEEQIETMERLISVSNEQLRALEVAAAQRAAERAPTADPVDSVTPMPEDITEPEPVTEQPFDWGEPIVDSPEEVVDETVEAETPEPVEPEVVAPSVQEPARVVRSAPQPKSLVDHLMDNLLLVGAGVIGLLLIALFIVHRRNANDGFDDDDYDEEEDFGPADIEDEDFSYTGDDEESIELSDEQLEPAEDYTEEEPYEEEVSAEAETGDVVGEADIYIAYGKLDQAEEMLLKGLSREPGSAPIMLKLLEVYTEQQNPEAFDQYYASLIKTGDRAAIDRAAEFRSGLSGAGEFDASLVEDTAAHSSASAPQAEQSEDDGFDFELGGESSEPLGGDEEAEDELSFDLGGDEDLSLEDDLTLDLEDEEPLTPDVPDVDPTKSNYDMSFEEPAEEEDLGFDFELDEEAEVEPLELELTDDSSSESVGSESEDFSFELEEPEETAAEEPEFTLSLDEEDAPPKLDAPTAEADQDDDFDPDRAMGDLDLASLDQEMAALDADLDSGDVALEAPVKAKAAPTPASKVDEDDDMFEQALSGLTGDDAASAEAMAADLSDEDMDAELDFLADADEAATKLDLARAYIDMGDSEGAKDILSEVTEEGNEEQRKEAEELLSRIS